MYNVFEMLGASFFLVLSMMGILWIIFFFRRNAGIVDIGWALGFVISSWVFFFLGAGYGPKKWVLTTMVTVWALRLAWHLYHRFIISKEDPRYQELRKNWGSEHANFKFLLLFIFQGVLVIILSLPFLIVNVNANPSWSGVEVFGIILWGIGVLGEACADNQLRKFKLKPENKDKVCRNGLWYFSRHPNYFFEFVVWVAFFLYALGTPLGWLSIISPALILCLLTQVSGIPLTEKQALKDKGPDYADYQRTTSIFIPWFPKS